MRRLRLAPGATGEDEGGEGSSKTGSGGGLVGLTMGGGGETVTAAVEKASGRAAVARSPLVDGRSRGRGRWRRERGTRTWT
jgi:hypothetical protein